MAVAFAKWNGYARHFIAITTVSRWIFSALSVGSTAPRVGSVLQNQQHPRRAQPSRHGES